MLHSFPHGSFFWVLGLRSPRNSGQGMSQWWQRTEQCQMVPAKTNNVCLGHSEGIVSGHNDTKGPAAPSPAILDWTHRSFPAWHCAISLFSPPSQLALGVTCGPVVGFPVAFISLPHPSALWRNFLTSLDSSEQSLHFHKLYCQLIWRLVLLRALQICPTRKVPCVYSASSPWPPSIPVSECTCVPYMCRCACTRSCFCARTVCICICECIDVTTPTCRSRYILSCLCIWVCSVCAHMMLMHMCTELSWSYAQFQQDPEHAVSPLCVGVRCWCKLSHS